MNNDKRRIAACALLWAAGSAMTLHHTAALAQDSAASATQSAEQRRHYEIAAGDLGKALDELADSNRLQIGYQPQLVSGKTASALNGEYSVREALTLLLEGSGLEAQFIGEKAIVIRRVGDASVELGNEAGGVEAAGLASADIGADMGEPVTSTRSAIDIARQGGIEEIIVTGQKREERIQDVPIAISAFSMDQLDNQKIEGGFDLLKAVPNVTFSKTNFSGYNFQIRGIGTQAVSATTDPGVAVSFNNTTLIVNRLFEQEYLDIERVEVLRGPQGTLFGRNATAGVINVISAKPKMGVYEGEIKVETGNYDSQRLRGHYNFALNDSGTLAGRVAYASTVRDGYGINEFDGSDLDNRDLWTGRLSLAWQPHERLRANVLWERFRENDQRIRSIKQLCHRDPGLDQVQGYDLTQLKDIQNYGTKISQQRVYQDQLTQGCLPGSLYDEGAFGTPNGLALPFVSAGRMAPSVGNYGNNPYARPEFVADAPCKAYETAVGLGFINLCNDDPFGGRTQSRDLRRIHSEIKPTYQAESDIFELSVDYDLSDSLLLSAQTVFLDDSVRSTQDLNRFATSPGFFNDSAIACAGGTWVACDMGKWSGGLFADMSPGGVMCDPQLGCSDRFRAVDLSRSVSTQFNQEIRLVSSFDGPLNYSLGANFTRFETLNDYFVFSNALTALANLNPFTGILPTVTSIICRPPGWAFGELISCLQTDQQSLAELVNGAEPYGHNYFLSRNPYELKSMAAFGELYWNATDNLKFTAGVRVTWDQKTFTPVPSQTLLIDYREGGKAEEHPSLCHGFSPTNVCGRMGTGPQGGGYPAEPDIVQSWLEPTGRLGFDWKPELNSSWVDESLIYAFYTRGYKAGGANPPGIANPAGAYLELSQGAEAPRVFKPEYVNALEIGSKNRLFGGLMTVNANAFYYDYSDYQVSKIVNRAANNENFDAKVWGAELELLLAPTTGTVLNASFGFLKTRIADGEKSIDLMDRTQGGGEMFVTSQVNPAFDPALPARAVEDYVAGLNAPADQEFLAYDQWVVVKPSVLQTSNCVVPADLVVAVMQAKALGNLAGSEDFVYFCPGGGLVGSYAYTAIPGTDDLRFNPLTDAPNGTAGFFADLGGHRLPNAPSFTVSLGAQQTFYLPGGWDITARADWYWQDESYARVYNTEYDRLKAWSNTSLSLWVSKPDWGLKVETYVKNVFDETPITGAYLGSDDTGLTTNVFTLDPRLVGVSITKQF